MAGGAGAGTAAIAVDAGHVVVDGGAHQRQAGGGVHGVALAAVGDEGDLGHGGTAGWGAGGEVRWVWRPGAGRVCAR